MPGKFIAAADVKEFEGAASSGAGGNVAKGAGGQEQSIGDQETVCVCQMHGMWIWRCVHMSELGRDNQSVVAHQRSARGANPFLSVLCQR